MSYRCTAYLAAVAALAVIDQVCGQVHDGDVIVDVVDGTIVTGAVDDFGQVQFPRFVWSSDFGSAGFPNFAADPGFDSFAGTFTPGTVVGVSIRKALRAWNIEEEHFDDIAKLTMSLSRFSAVITSPANDPLPGESPPSLSLAAANASGLIHVHPDYFLDAPHTGGVYLLELEFWANAGGIKPSQPFWIVFNQNQSPAVVAAAVAWVEDNLIASPCPADLNNDGSVDVSDLLMLFAAWGSNPGHAADLNGDGSVDVSDLLLLFGAWGACSL